MVEFEYIPGPRKGKVGNEKYYLRNNNNFIQTAKKYIPIHSQWITKKDFKDYILSLLNKGIPEIYVLEELPEEIYPYALIFIQNEENKDIYLDKEGVRTQILLPEDDYDAVDVVDDIPQEPRNNVVYFVLQPARKLNKNSIDYDVFACENNVLKKIDLYEVDSTLDMQNNVIGMPQKLDAPKTLGLYRTAFDEQGRCVAAQAQAIPTYSVNSTLTMSSNVIGMPNKLSAPQSLNLYKTAFDVQGRCTATQSVTIPTYSVNTTLSMTNNVIGMPNKLSAAKSLNLYKTAFDVQGRCTDAQTVTIPTYSVNSTLTMSSNVIGMPNKLSAAKSLNVYKTAFDVQGRCTDAQAVTIPPAVHLYLHRFSYDRSGNGEICFTIYNSQSTSMDKTAIYYFLQSIGCNNAWNCYPATGCASNGTLITGIVYSTSGNPSPTTNNNIKEDKDLKIDVLGFSCCFFQNTTYYYDWCGNYANTITEKIIQIF